MFMQATINYVSSQLAICSESISTCAISSLQFLLQPCAKRKQVAFLVVDPARGVWSQRTNIPLRTTFCPYDSSSLAAASFRMFGFLRIDIIQLAVEEGA